MNSAPSSVPLPLNPSTYGSSFASAFSVRHPNFDSGSLDNADCIRGGFLSRRPHIYTPELGVFYRNIDLEHHHLFPSDLVYKQLTRTGWLVVRLEQLDNILDTSVFEFALLTDCLAVVKCRDLVHVFTQGNMAGGVIDRQVSSTHCGASAGATPEYTACCQSSEGPEITGGPKYGSARSCDLCTVIRRSDRSGGSEFRGSVVTDTGVVMDFRRLAQTRVRSSGVPRHDRDSVPQCVTCLRMM
jgi:hypothetical protein